MPEAVRLHLPLYLSRSISNQPHIFNNTARSIINMDSAKFPLHEAAREGKGTFTTI